MAVVLCPQTVVDEWLETYKQDQETGFLELANFIIRSCGCRGGGSLRGALSLLFCWWGLPPPPSLGTLVSPLGHPLGRHGDPGDVQEPAELGDHPAADGKVRGGAGWAWGGGGRQRGGWGARLTPSPLQDSSEYPLSLGTQPWRRFRAGFCELVAAVVRQCQYTVVYDGFLMDTLISLLTGLSDSQVRAFRHTSTLAGRQLPGGGLPAGSPGGVPAPTALLSSHEADDGAGERGAGHEPAPGEQPAAV